MSRMDGYSVCCLHPQRGAAGICKGCARPFCRECLTEHDYRFLCKSCMAALVAADARRATLWAWISRPAAAIASFLAVYLTFFAFGKIIALIPPEYHMVRHE